MCFFFRQHLNKLPRGEFLGGLYDHTVKIWKLYVRFSSCFSLVKVELPVAGAAKFEMCVIIHFLLAEGQLADLESHFSVSSSLEVHFWDVPEAKNVVQPNSYSKGRGISFCIFSDQFDRIPIAGWPSACKNCFITYVSNLAASATGNFTFTRLKHNKKHTYSLQMFTLWSYKPLNILLLVVYFSVSLKKKDKKYGTSLFEQLSWSTSLALN